jgi:translocation and assembly module TamB
VELKGYLSNLQVNLTSTPGLPREDVLSLITTGHTQEELRAAGVNRQSMGMGVLAGELTSAIEQPITRRTGLDVFRLEASESGQLSKVSVGKYVTDRLTLEFQSDFAPETAQRTVQANYYLTDNILLKGTRIWENNQGTGPRFNFNLSFRFRLF